MSGIKRFIKALEASRKKKVLFFCISMGILIALYTTGIRMVYRQLNIVKDDYSWMFQIDSMEEEHGKLRIKGWAFALKQDSKPKNVEVILYNETTGKKLYPKMSYEPREDVNAYFSCEYDYTKSGFTATLPVEKIEKGIYEVLLRPEKKRSTFSTGIFYSDGNLSFVRPDALMSLDVAGTDLETIVNEGVLRVYRPDCGVYVYQYNGDIYWIVEEWSEFASEQYVVQYQMNTTQIDNLPQERIENGYLWSNLNFYFKNNELLDWNTGKYRVTKCALPTEYSVTNIWTGYHTDKWVWQENFRPWYEFE